MGKIALRRGALLCALVVLAGPAVARADTTISSSPTTASQPTPCNFTASVDDQNVAVTDLDTCLASGTATVTVTASGSSLLVENAVGSGAGSLTLTAPSGITLSAAIDVGSLSLEGAGGLTASGSGAVSAPSFSLTSDANSARTWTISGTSVNDGSGGGAIPYSGVNSLSVSGGFGGDTFDVAPSASTEYTLDGGTNQNGVLNYDAQGRIVSGSPQAPNGEIDAPGVQPVMYSDMRSVVILNPGHSGGGPPPPVHHAPVCTLRAPSNRVAHHGRGKHVTYTLTLRATCNQAAAVTLHGSVTELLRPATRHHRAVTRTIFLGTVRANVSAGVPKNLVVALPKSVTTPLLKRVRESASFALTGSNANGRATATLKFARLVG